MHEVAPPPGIILFNKPPPSPLLPLSCYHCPTSGGRGVSQSEADSNLSTWSKSGECNDGKGPISLKTLYTENLSRYGTLLLFPSFLPSFLRFAHPSKLVLQYTSTVQYTFFPSHFISFFFSSKKNSHSYDAFGFPSRIQNSGGSKRGGGGGGGGGGPTPEHGLSQAVPECWGEGKASHGTCMYHTLRFVCLHPFADLRSQALGQNSMCKG